MNIIENQYILQLNGYLHCLSRLCGPGYSFSANAYFVEDDIDIFVSQLTGIWGQGDNYVQASDYTFKGKEQISYSDLCDEILGFIQNGCISPQVIADHKTEAYLKRMLIEDVNEYYGLASNSLNQNGAFHPLISEPVYQLNIINEKYERSLYFIVKIESIYVLTHYSKRAK